jgi:hypothetical protein
MRAVESLRAHSRMKGPAVALLALAAFCAACGNSSTTAPSTTTSPTTETLNGSMAPKGQAIRTFTATQAGTVSVTLASAGPPSTIVLGVGVGLVSTTTGDICEFSRTVNTPAGTTPQITVSVDAGTYCAGAYDIGNVGTAGITVAITVTHP